jgi:hypothetical protein
MVSKKPSRRKCSSSELSSRWSWLETATGLENPLAAGFLIAVIASERTGNEKNIVGCVSNLFWYGRR